MDETDHLDDASNMVYSYELGMVVDTTCPAPEDDSIPF